MPDLLPSSPPCRREDALAVLRRLREAGYVAYFAGGCVRDLLLGIEPKDFDVATDAPPARVREIFRNSQAVGQAFGVILVRVNGSQVEVATFRSDGKYADGRRPEEVTFTTPEVDAQRRDFTINGLFLDPLADKVIDYVGGQADLYSRTLRAIGEPDHRFDEDHLRLLRAVRFAARFGLSVDPRTAAAIRSHAPLLKRISPERIADELRRMLTPVTRCAAWRMLWDYLLVREIFRFLPAPHPQSFDPARSIYLAHHPDEPIAFGESLAAATLCYRFQADRSADVLALLTPDAIGQATRALRQGLKISNEESDLLHHTLIGTQIMLAHDLPTLARKKRLLARPAYPSACRLVDSVAATGQHRPHLAALASELASLEQTDYAPPPLMTGDDLVTLGLPPGPMFKRILDQLYDAQLEHRITTRDQALEMAIQLKGPPSP